MKPIYPKKRTTLTATCERCGSPCSKTSDSRLCKLCYNLPWEPSPLEIRAACREIQATWTAHEESIRRGHRGGDEWTPPVIAMPSMETE